MYSEFVASTDGLTKKQLELKDAIDSTGGIAKKLADTNREQTPLYNVKSLFLSTKDILGIVDGKIKEALNPKLEVQDEIKEPTVTAPAQPTGFTQPAPADKPREETPTLQIDSDYLPF